MIKRMDVFQCLFYKKNIGQRINALNAYEFSFNLHCIDMHRIAFQCNLNPTRVQRIGNAYVTRFCSINTQAVVYK